MNPERAFGSAAHSAGPSGRTLKRANRSWAWSVLVAGLMVSGGRLSARGDGLDTAGYYKNLVSVTDVKDNYRNLGLTEKEAALDMIQRVRLKLDAAPVDRLELRIHYEVRAAWGETERIRNRAASLPDTGPGAVLLDAPERRRFLDLEWDLHGGDALSATHGLDRLQGRWVSDRLDLTIGRQAVSWGVGRIWAPTDLFTGFAPNEIDRDEKPGVDVVRAVWSPNYESALDLIFEPLDEVAAYDMDPDDSSLALRASTHVGEFDLAGLGGWIAGDQVAGGSFSGYLRDAGFRGEFLYTQVREPDQPDYARFLVSLDYGFSARWNPVLVVEYLYNGLGTDDENAYLERLLSSSVRRAFARGNAFNVGRHYLGGTVSLLPSALWSLQATTLINLLDGSVLEYAAATRSLHDNVDLLIGVNAAFGKPGSEFGGFTASQAGVDYSTPDFLFAFLKWYF